MYFTADTQSKVLERFHFALRPDGVLFLGKAEMLLSHGELFQPFDLKRRFFRKVPRPYGNGGRFLSGNGYPDPASEVSSAVALRTEGLATSPLATLLVTADGILAFANQRAEVMFGLTARDIGRPFRDLDVSYRPLELRAYLDEATRERRSSWVREVEAIRGPGESLYLDINVMPLIGADGASLGAAIYFTDVSRYRKLQGELEVSNRQLETAYEELQSTVEELETTNEELQSTVEELETTNEELQSTNDELQTINDELRERTQELHSTNGFLESILRSLSTAVIVVDSELTVTAWNARAEDMWGVRADEAVGHALLNLDIGIAFDPIRPMVRSGLGGDGEIAPLRLEAINRRGRTIEVEVRCVPLATDGESRGVIVLIDEL
jgi:two-component system CheB/CheR fusion protein